mmetsp:Transcript_24416/g.27153  ORF Transcript_24416/g.27153 Transcript_24416/m.27153 type:complete len:672 (+) Transcript_24416:194-2209(+)
MSKRDTSYDESTEVLHERAKARRCLKSESNGSFKSFVNSSTELPTPFTPETIEQTGLATTEQGFGNDVTITAQASASALHSTSKHNVASHAQSEVNMVSSEPTSMWNHESGRSAYDAFAHGNSTDALHQNRTQQSTMRPRSQAPVVKLTINLDKTYSNLTKVFAHKLSQVQQVKERNYYKVQLGEMLGDFYQVTEILGAGSHAQAVAAVDTRTEEKFAIKIVRNSPAFKTGARQEIEILKFLNASPHGTSHIVEYKTVFEHNGHMCIVFELLSHNLLKLLNFTIEKTSPGLSLRVIKKICYQLLYALIVLRNKKIIHRDLKPENIVLISPTSAHVKLIDFGSSVSASNKDELKYPYVQSRYYRAPEILLGTEYSYPIDMWSLGCVLVELYTAQPLFRGDDSKDQLYKIIDVLGPPSSTMMRGYYARHIFKVGRDTLPRQDGERTSLLDIIESKKAPDINVSELEAFHDLVSKMLVYEPRNRITPLDAVNHPFLKKKFAKQPKIVQPSAVQMSPNMSTGGRRMSRIVEPQQQQRPQERQQRRSQEVAPVLVPNKHIHRPQHRRSMSFEGAAQSASVNAFYDVHGYPTQRARAKGYYTDDGAMLSNAMHHIALNRRESERRDSMGSGRSCFWPNSIRATKLGANRRNNPRKRSASRTYGRQTEDFDFSNRVTY